MVVQHGTGQYENSSYVQCSMSPRRRRRFAIGAIFKTPQSNREMRSGMPRAARRPINLANLVNSVNLVLLDLLSSRRWFAPLGSENSHFFKWLFTKMAVSMVRGRESEQELKESHLMLKNAWLCFSISSSFVGNNPSLQIHSFSEDWRKCNKTSNPSICYFSTMLDSQILILADEFLFTKWWSLQTTHVPPMLSFIGAL